MEPEASANKWQAMLASVSAASTELAHCLTHVHEPALEFEASLRNPNERRAALRALLLWRDRELLQKLFPCLVDLASEMHGDIDLVGSVIATVPRQWATNAIAPEVARVLAQAPSPPWEEYRRFATLYDEFFPSLLPALAAQALAHPDPDVREVGKDYHSPN
jgi:hypothetical protein